MTALNDEMDSRICETKDLVVIPTLTKGDIQFFMDNLGEIYWSNKHSSPARLEQMPISVQIPFILKFVRDEDLAERVGFIKDPLVFIELYIKSKFISNEPLEL